MDRREFMKGAALGVGAGVLGSMGLYSYSPLRRAFLPEVKRGTADIGVCKSVKVTNISETSWFDNGIFMNDVTGAGGLLVDQYTFNWAPFGNGKGVGKGTFEEGLKRIFSSTSCRTRSTRRGPSPRKTASMPTTRAATPASSRSRAWKARQPVTCSIPGGITDWMDTCFKREGIDVMLADNKIRRLHPDP